MNKIIRYFDLLSQYRPGGPLAVAEGDEKKLGWVAQYIALLAGVIIQPFLQDYINTHKWNLEGFGGWVIASIFIAIMAFPAIYKNSIDATKPIFVQCCVIFTSGMGWQTLVAAIHPK